MINKQRNEKTNMTDEGIISGLTVTFQIDSAVCFDKVGMHGENMASSLFKKI